MGKESEDYLDQLLSAVQEEVPQNKGDAVNFDNSSDETFGEDPFETRKAQRKERTRRHKRDASDAFLAEFEKELMESDTGEYLSDLELDMEAGDMKVSENLDADMAAEQPEAEVKPEVQEPVKEEALPIEDEPVETMSAESQEADFPSFEEMFPPESAGIPESTETLSEAMPEESAEDSILSGLDAIMNPGEGTDIPSDLFGMPDISGDMSQEEAPGVSDVMEEAGFGDLGFGMDESSDSGDVTSLGEDSSSDDIISMLNGLGEGDDDLKDIGSMLSADENGESIIPEGGDITAAELAGNLAGLGFDIDIQAGDDEPAEIRDITDERNALIKEAEEKKAEPKGFLGKLKALFFGNDDEEENPDIPVIANAKKKDIDTIAGELADENDDILRALEGGGELGEETPAEPELDEKAKKAKEKEEKKKAKEAKKKEKAEKKAAAKAAKPPKVKKPKPPKVKTKPLPKGPVFVILLLAATILFGTIFIGRTAHYKMTVNKAEEMFAQGKYIEAYNLLNPLTIKKDDDKLLYRKVKMLACMQEFYRSYEVLVSSGRNELALDSLVRMIGHYDVQINDAGEYGISAELTDFEGKAEKLLKDVYNVSFEDALALYKQRDRQTYSMELIKVLLRAGIS